MNAWPALTTVDFDGWTMRMSNGFGRRVNSVSPLEMGSIPVVQKISFCEGVFCASHLAPTFRLTPLCNPQGFDSLLAEMGYKPEGQVSVQGLKLDYCRHSLIEECLSSGREEWVRALGCVASMQADKLEEFGRIASYIQPPARFCRIDQDGVPVAVGMAVVEDGWAGIFNVEVEPSRRRRGLGRAIMLDLLSWGHGNGATNAYLFVTQENNPALGLYKQLGFAHLYPYWFRRKRLKLED